MSPSIQVTLHFELFLADAMRLVPVEFRPARAPAGKTHRRNSFPFAPSSASVETLQPIQLPDRAAGRNRLDLRDGPMISNDNGSVSMLVA
jgi:hypothetical protein